jgi:hypothetical protein
MTNLEALFGEIEPFTVSPITAEKIFIDYGIDKDDEYDKRFSRKIAKCALEVLKRLTVLTSESSGKMSQGYDRKALENRIKDLCDELGEDASNILNTPEVIVYHNLM